MLIPLLPTWLLPRRSPCRRPGQFGCRCGAGGV